MNILELQRKYNDFVANIDNEIEQAVATVEYLLLDLNREQMKNRQVDKFDKPIEPEYSPFWRNAKNLTNPNLYLTGSFQNKLVMSMRGNEYLIKSTDYKNDKLTRKYSENIFGIAPSNRQKAYTITNKAIAARLK